MSAAELAAVWVSRGVGEWVAYSACGWVGRRAVDWAANWVSLVPASAAKSVSRDVVLAEATAAQRAAMPVGAKAETLDDERAVRLAWSQAGEKAVQLVC